MKLIVDEMARFRMLVSAILVALAVSTMYGFSLFTEELKEKYGFTQGDITTISTVCNVLGYCAFFFGILLDYAGPKVQLMLSGSFAIIGLLLFGLTLDGVIHSDNRQTMLILMCIFNGIMYLGCPSLDGCSVLPLLMNFPLNRGHIIIIEKTFAGLGTSVLMAYFNAFFKERTTADTKFSSYAYFLGVHAFLCAAFGAIFIDFPSYSPCDRLRRLLSKENLEERKESLKVYLQQPAPILRLAIGCTLVIALLIHLTVSSVVSAYVTVSKGSYIAIWVIAIVLMVSFTLLALPFQWLGRFEVGSRKYHLKGLLEVDSDGTEEPIRVVEAPEVLTASGEPQYGGSFWSHLLTLDLWLFWFSLFSMWGTSTVLQFNSAQVYRSKNMGVYSDTIQSFNVAIIGVGSAIGRISGGVVDLLVARARAAGKKHIYATLFFPVCSILLGLGFLLLILLPVDAMVFPLLLASMGNGLGWALGVVCVRLMYAEDMGKHYNFMFSSGIIATVGLNRFMFGDMFDQVASQLGTSPSCNAPECVTRQMWILFWFNVGSTVAATLMHWRFSRFSNAKRTELDEAPVIEKCDVVHLVTSQEWDGLMKWEEKRKLDFEKDFFFVCLMFFWMVFVLFFVFHSPWLSSKLKFSVLPLKSSQGTFLG